MKIAVIGEGYVGLTTAACLAHECHEVSLVDPNPVESSLLDRGVCPIYEPGLRELLTDPAHPVTISHNIRTCVEPAEVVFIAIRTPTADNGEPDLHRLVRAVRAVAAAMNGYKVIAIRSTVPVGTCRKLMGLVRQITSHPFDLVSNPEFLRDGAAVQDFCYPDRVIIGTDSQRAGEIMTDVYRDFRLPRIVRLESAELIKQGANGFLAMKISYANLLAGLCEKTGADISEVTDAVGADARIGRAYFKPGIGYGGTCLPHDVNGLVHALAINGEPTTLVEEVQKINTRVVDRFVASVANALGDVEGKVLAVLGVAFKGGTCNLDHSPALRVITALRDRGCTIRVYDPAVQLLNVPGATQVPTAAQACTGADAILILTDWSEFNALNFNAIRALVRSPIVIDGRNLLDPKRVEAAGFQYHAFGRPLRKKQTLAAVPKPKVLFGTEADRSDFNHVILAKAVGHS